MVETLVAPNHRENILTALSKVPVATAEQIAHLNDSLSPYKKASSLLNQLQREGLVEYDYHKLKKLWKLTKKGRQLQGITPTRLSSNLDHILAVVNLYFILRPKAFLYEPKESFQHIGQEFVWNPDCVLVHDRKVYVCEVQLSPLSAKEWAKKWSIYNAYFNHGYFHDAAFQEWGKGKIIMPQFLVFSSQDKCVEGFEVKGRELIQSKPNQS